MGSSSWPNMSVRPSPETILQQWNTFYTDPLLSLAHIKAKAVAGQIPESGLRSLYWRHFFGILPSPSPKAAEIMSTYALSLSHARSEYSDLRTRFLRSPDGGWVNDGEAGSSLKAVPYKIIPEKSTKVNDPLSLDADNPWQTWFADLETRKVIRQDVQRTFPEIDYFRHLDVQDRMTDLLFIFTKMTPEIGYRQGMHELLAPIMWAVDFDSLPNVLPNSSASSASSESPNYNLAHLVLSEEHIEHDTWSVFVSLMKSAEVFYDHKPSIAIPAQANEATSTTSLTLNHAVPGTSGFSGSNAQVLVQPIVGTAIRIHDGLLKLIDHELWLKLEHLKIEPQLYIIRWLRLLLGREYPIKETLLLWDALFSEDTSLRLMEFLCVAMLLRIRDAIIDSDYSGVLQLLLRYPAQRDGQYRINLLFRHALLLRDNISAAAGERCRQENRELQANSGEATENGRVKHKLADSRSLPSQSHKDINPQPSMGALFAEGGLVGDIAKGVYGRAEALGINRALFGTFNDIRRSPNSVAVDNSFSQIPAKAPWELNGRTTTNNYQAEVIRMRSANQNMAKALQLCVEVVERKAQDKIDEKDVNPNSEGSSSQSSQVFMALTVLSHIQNVLSGTASTFDSNVLLPLISSLSETSPVSTIIPPALPANSDESQVSQGVERNKIDEVPKVQSSPPPPPLPSKSPEIGFSAASKGASLMLGERHARPLPGLTRVPVQINGLGLRSQVPLRSNYTPVSTGEREEVPEPVMSSGFPLSFRPITDPSQMVPPSEPTRRREGGFHLIDPLGVSEK